MFEPLYTADEMVAAEQGHDVGELMERAGRAVADVVCDWYPDARRIAGVCGRGANGGDGRIALGVLRERGLDAEESEDLQSADVVLDALFGTGFRGAPRPEAAALIERINASGAEVVAVDIPSGVDASTGEVPGVAVEADLTITFHGEKVGHFVTPGHFRAGAVECVDIGLDPAETHHVRATRELLELVPQRMPNDTKYTAGSVLVVGGSPGMSGAVCLTALAAFRADAGYVAVAAPEEVIRVVEVRVLEAVKRRLEDAFDAVERASAVALGPGLGRGDEQRSLVRRFLEQVDLPIVVDADALDGLEPGAWSGRAVLTPHSGELARLLGVESAWVDAHRLEALDRAVERFGCVVVLKGDGTLVGAPDAGTIVAGGFATLATAGTGDVLTGIVAAFLAKGMEPRLAAAAAVVAHTHAAIEAPQKAGLVASDLIDALPSVLSSV